MLHELHVTDLGVIEDVDVGFDPGLNVLTGETGAGKTMITVALALALGRRTSSALVRDGSRSARVQARFDATPAAEEDGWSEDGALVLARTIEADGRSSARAGAQIVPASVLEALAGDLVEVHGQHESTLLRTASAQTAFLDRFAGEGHLREVAAFGDAFTRLRRVNTEVEELERRERDREREADVLAFQIGEIEAVAPRPGELEELNAEAARLANVERIVDRATAAERAAAIDGGAAERLAIAASALEEVAALDPDAGSLAQRATTLGEEASELARDLRRYSDAIDADPARLDELNARIAAVRSLLRKYGATEEDVLEFLGTARDRVAALGSANQRRAELRRDVAALTARVDAAASAISVARAETAPRLAAAIEAELTELGMAGARVSVELRP